MFIVYFVLDILAIVAGFKLIKMAFSFLSAGMDRLTDEGTSWIRGRNKGRRIMLQEDEDGNLYYEE